MKKLYVLFFVLYSLQALATAPTIPASNLNFPAVDGGFLNVAWTAGNGARRIIICRAGSPVSFVPQNGSDYTANNTFGSGQQVAPGEYVIYNSAFTSFFLTGLSPATQYFFAVFEYNGTGAGTEYLTSSFLTGQGSTSAVPALQTSNANFTNITTNSVTITWTNGSGARRLIVGRQGEAVTSDPVNGQPYNVNSSFGSGATIGAGNFTLYNSSGSATTITNLQPGTTYFFSFYEFNGSSQPQYKTPAYTSQVTTRSVPTVASSNITVTKTDGKQLNLSWTNGNGQRRIVVAKQGSDLQGLPVNGVDYAANGVFGAGPTIAPGEFVVYDDNFPAASITGLNPATQYFFRIFEYDGTGSQALYLTSSFASGSASTASTPTVQASSVTASSVTATSLSLSWTPGNGRARLILGRKDLPVSFTPQDFTAYTANSDFGLGQDLGNGQFVLGNTTTTGVNIHALQPNSTYHFAVWEYNGFDQPLYLSPAAVFSISTSGTLPVKLTGWEAQALEDKVKLNWTTAAETNASHFIIERSADGMIYSALVSVHAAGNSQAATQYSALDHQPLPGKSFYRLKMVDDDGSWSYSPVRTVLFASKQTAILLANPVQQSLELVLSFSDGKRPAWEIVNPAGQVLKKGSALAGRNEIRVSFLPKGTYWIRIHDQHRSQSIAFVKQ